MQLLREYPKDTLLLTADKGPASWLALLGMCRFGTMPPCSYILARSCDTFDVVTSTDTKCLQFSGTLSGQPCRYKLDSGASHCFLNAAFTQQHGIAVTPCAQTVELADGDLVPTIGTCSSRVRIGRTTDVESFYVFPMSAAYDAILGEKWLKKRRAVLDFGAGTITLHKGPNTVAVQCCRVPAAPPAATLSGGELTADQNGGGSGDNSNSGHVRMPIPVVTQDGGTTVHDTTGSAPDARVATGLSPKEALPSSEPFPTLSALQFKRAVRKGAHFFLAQVRLAPEAEPVRVAAASSANLQEPTAVQQDGLVPAAVLEDILSQYQHVFDDVPGGTIARPGLPR
jgi:hypothetical protein